MTEITSRKNEYIRHLRQLAAERSYRTERAEYLCDGLKLLKEAVQFGACVTSVLWKDKLQSVPGLDCAGQYVAPAELFDYASPMKNSPGPLFTVAVPVQDARQPIGRAIVLENVQDPGNVGTVIRTANAFGIDDMVDMSDFEAAPGTPAPKTNRHGKIISPRKPSTQVTEPSYEPAPGAPVVDAPAQPATITVEDTRPSSSMAFTPGLRRSPRPAPTFWPI